MLHVLISEITTETIPTLESGQTYTMQYEVRVKTDITTGTEISNKAIVTYNNETTESAELKNILQEAKLCRMYCLFWKMVSKATTSTKSLTTW